MPVIDVIWDLPDDPDGNVQHIAQHGLVPSDVEHVLNQSSAATRRQRLAGVRKPPEKNAQELFAPVIRQSCRRITGAKVFETPVET